MYWIIQDNMFAEPFYERLIDFLSRMDIPFEIVKAVPFVGDLLPVPKPTRELVFAIGSYSMVLATRDRYGWSPGCFSNADYDYAVWSNRWAGYCLNEGGTTCKFGEVPDRDGEFFIRPSADSKAFSGMVTSPNEFREWQHKVLNLGETYTELDHNTLVVVADPKPISAEYRFVIIDGKVITGSLYKSGYTVLYRECQEDDVIEFAQKMADIWSPSRGFVLDLARSNGELYVLEMGCMNAAGLYDCDVQKLVMAVEGMEF